MSHLQQIIEDRLGSTLTSWLQEANSEGTSCREIAKRLQEATGIPVSKSAVNYWLQTERGKA